MTAQAHTSSAAPSALLRRALVADTLYEAALGVVCLVGAAPIAAFMGLESVWIMILGIGALVAAAALAGISAAGGWTRGRLMLLIDLNIVGAALLAALALANIVPMTDGGKLVTLFVAADFAILGALEYYALRRMQ